MPSRKSEGSAEKQRERQSSLQRLASIASFHNFLNRRRSHAFTDTISDSNLASSSSNLSLLSTVANPPQPSTRLISSTANPQRVDSSQQLPETHPQRATSTRVTPHGSYVCLPDDPMGGMPRSRTFSALPTPSRPRRTASLKPPKSHVYPPTKLERRPTRLPTPTTSNRRYKNSRLASNHFDTPSEPQDERVDCLETEPLVKSTLDQPGNLPRSTAFKENLSLSPIKPMPSTAMFGPTIEGVAKTSKFTATGLEEGPLGTTGDMAGDPPFTICVDDREPRTITVPQTQSSPVRRDSKGIELIDGQKKGKLSRWVSQPILTNITNQQSNHRREIKQSRLMSVRQPPTPQPVLSPLMAKMFDTGKRQKQSKSSSPASSPLSPLTTPSNRSNHLQVSNAQPSSYWAGRFSALADRYRNEELESHLGSGATSKAETDKIHSYDAATARFRHAFIHLHELCTTPDAGESLAVFQREFARLSNLPELSSVRPKTGPGAIIAKLASGSSKNPVVRVRGQRDDATTEANSLAMSEARKAKFMERLLGR